MKDIASVKSAMLAQFPRFGLIADPGAQPFPVEATLDEALSEIKSRLKLGMALHPPVRAIAGEKFAGMQLLMMDPQPPPGVQKQPKTRLVVQIATDLEDIAAQADQNFLAYALMAVVFSEFMEEARAEDKARKEAPAEIKKDLKKLGDTVEAAIDAGKVESLPGAATEPVKQPDAP